VTSGAAAPTAGRVAGRVALVTGAASGIGRACARALAREGARVAVADVDEAGGRAVAEELGDAGRFVRLDVSDEEGWRAALGETRERLGGLHVLVNNAAILLRADVESTRVEDWRRVMAVNAEGVFLGCKHALPLLRAHAGEGAGGSIVNVSSLAGLVGTPAFAAYSASKGAVRLLTKTVAAHCRERGDAIRCNSIHPGGVTTGMVSALVQQGTGVDLDDPQGLADKARALGMGTPEEIAHLVVYLASDESRYVNGAEIAIDGGLAAI